MIVASGKAIAEIKGLLARHDRVLFAGCGTCVTVCLAGGEREVGIMSYAIRMARRLDGRPIEIEQMTIERQCENEFIADLAPAAERNDAILSFGCGAGVQAIAERFPEKPVYAALDTQFLGILEEQGTWTEKCLGCGSCLLARFGGICPITRCAKRLLNGPCGGSSEEGCEVDPTRPCAWQLIYRRLEAIGQLDNLNEIVPPRDWRTSWQASPRRIVREEHRI
jgi:ferredoxin